MLKTKIKIILPYWLSLLLVLTALEAGSSLIVKKQTAAVNRQAILESAKPEVLGAFTDVRGSESSATVNSAPKQTGALNLESLSAKSYLAYDFDQGTIFAQKNIEDKLSIASLTKLLTALVVYEKTDFNATFTISSFDVLSVKPSLGLAEGDVVSVRDLFNSMLVGSCNDAALALANFTAQTARQDFVGLMNGRAAALGMSNSRFSNPIGFDIKQNFSTAEDLKKLIRATRQLQAFKNLSKLTKYSFTNERGQKYTTFATNKLVGKYKDLEAIKTGYTESAQGSMITKLAAGTHQIILIIIGSDNREKDTLELRKQLLANFNWE